jgi:hypothetical protein
MSSSDMVASSAASERAQAAHVAMWARAAAFSGAEGSNNRLERSAWQILQFIVLLNIWSILSFVNASRNCLARLAV